jgi:kynurenine formamidase
VSFAERHGITREPLTSTSIPIEHIKQLVEEQNVTFRPGDILFLRVGFTVAYDSLDAAAQHALICRPAPDYLGVEASVPMLRWLWESGFAAVASDAPCFEQAPVRGSWDGEDLEECMKGGGLLHQVLLSGWGLPIGELFDLESLSEVCNRLGRWTFFVSSVPLKVRGGVASPPNAVAIF